MLAAAAGFGACTGRPESAGAAPDGGEVGTWAVRTGGTAGAGAGGRSGDDAGTYGPAAGTGYPCGTCDPTGGEGIGEGVAAGHDAGEGCCADAAGAAGPEGIQPT